MLLILMLQKEKKEKQGLQFFTLFAHKVENSDQPERSGLVVVQRKLCTLKFGVSAG